MDVTRVLVKNNALSEHRRKFQEEDTEEGQTLPLGKTAWGLQIRWCPTAIDMMFRYNTYKIFLF